MRAGWSDALARLPGAPKRAYRDGAPKRAYRDGALKRAYRDGALKRAYRDGALKRAYRDGALKHVHPERAPSHAYPERAPFVRRLGQATTSLALHAPGSRAEGRSRQQPRPQNELYVVQAMRACLRIGAESFHAVPDDVLFLPAGADHRFERWTPGLATWVVFHGAEGGVTA